MPQTPQTNSPGSVVVRVPLPQTVGASPPTPRPAQRPTPPAPAKPVEPSGPFRSFILPV